MRRLRDERGGIAVMLALLMPILFGAAAIAIDTAAVWSARAQVETGADAAVIAVAMDCARGSCGDIKKTAEDAFWANDRAAKVSDLGPGEGWISVSGREISATQKMPWRVNHFFAGALGFDTGTLSVQSFAEWAPATRATADVPLTISRCTYDTLRGSMTSSSSVSLSLTTAIDGTCTSGGDTVPAGQALTEVDGSPCGTASSWNDTVKRYKPDTGLPAGCTSGYLAGLAGKDIWLPVFDEVTGNGNGQKYRVYGYAAFRVTSYDGAGQALNGYFTYAPRQVDDTTPPAPNAPDLGARSVYLTDD
jgi:hypothetical protein